MPETTKVPPNPLLRVRQMITNLELQKGQVDPFLGSTGGS